MSQSSTKDSKPSLAAKRKQPLPTQRSRDVMTGLTPEQSEAWLRMGERIVDGMDVAAAMALFRKDCETTTGGETA